MAQELKDRCSCLENYEQNWMLVALNLLLESEQKTADTFLPIKEAPKHVEEFRRLNRGVHLRRIEDLEHLQKVIGEVPLCSS